MLEEGFTDNGGLIHSAERILDILGMRLRYPRLTHINLLARYDEAEFSRSALRTYRKGGKVKIEHVAPHRALTRGAIALLDKGASNEKVRDYVLQRYRLVLLTGAEMRRLNRINRTKMSDSRLDTAEIIVRTAEAWDESENC